MTETEEVFTAIAVVLGFAAAASYLNTRYLRLPPTIALMAISLALSLVIVVLGATHVLDQEATREFVDSLHFDEVLLHGLLAYLLFAGALHIDLNALRGVMAQTASLATFSVVASGAIAGTLFWGIATLLEFDIGLIQGLLFGALIAPTDPVAVLGILKRAGAPQPLETTMAGESLFNDGVGVVVFLTIASIAFAGEEPVLSKVGGFLLLEAGGGALLGLALGWITYHLMRSIEDYSAEVLLSLAWYPAATLWQRLCISPGPSQWSSQASSLAIKHAPWQCQRPPAGIWTTSGSFLTTF
jgi:CPA1 family monovalent cation:H+ antiporter